MCRAIDDRPYSFNRYASAPGTDRFRALFLFVGWSFDGGIELRGDGGHGFGVGLAELTVIGDEAVGLVLHIA